MCAFCFLRIYDIVSKNAYEKDKNCFLSCALFIHSKIYYQLHVRSFRTVQFPVARKSGEYGTTACFVGQYSVPLYSKITQRSHDRFFLL